MENPSPWNIGSNYIIRTVTMHLTGKLVSVHEHELVLEDAAWIACSKRWATTLTTGEFEEVEPFPSGPVIVGRGAIVDAAVWPHALPRKQK